MLKQESKEESPDVLRKEGAKEVLKGIKESLEQGLEKEDTKYSILERMQDFEKVPFFTEWENTKQVFQANKILMLSHMLPFVFGTNKEITDIADKFEDHHEDHMLHMTSKNRKRELAIVHALRNDEGLPATAKEVKRWLGGVKT